MKGTDTFSSNLNMDSSTVVEDNNLNAPSIKVSTSTNEMHRVLESGNSLEVVFNEDHIARKSGGTLMFQFYLFVCFYVLFFSLICYMTGYKLATRTSHFAFEF